MPTITTTQFSQVLADQVKEMFTEPSPTNVYIGIGRAQEWDDDNTPPTPSDTIQTVNDAWKNLLSVKRVYGSDVAYVIPRYDWATGTVYTQYDDQEVSLNTQDFYVLSSELNVYKCIDNNSGATSAVEPTSTATSLIYTADGYVWKYMFSVSAPDAVKWLTSDWIPVRVIETDDSSNQWAVQEAAVDGSIDKIEIVSDGTGYLSLSGTVADSNSSVVTLESNAVTDANALVGSSVFIDSGTGSGQIREISAYSGSPNYQATLSADWDITPANTSTYIVGPTVNIVGNGSGAEAYVSTVSGDGNVGGVTMISGGSGYSDTDVTLTANTSHGSGAELRAIHSPSGGHGANSVFELYGSSLMFNIQLDGTESGDFTTENDFRQVMMISDIKDANGDIATTATLNNVDVLHLSSVVGTFEADETITGSVYTGTANVIEPVNANNELDVISDNNIDLQVGETITGGTSGATAIISSIDSSELTKNSGRMMFIENRVPVQRANTQIEDIRHTIVF